MSLSKYPEKAFLEAIGKNIKAYRVKKGLTLEQLGEDIGTDKSNMLRIEQGKNITLLTLLKLSGFLEVEPHILIKTTFSMSMEDIEKYVIRKKDKKPGKSGEK
ncbi:MAG: helix-turn-helix transcriptional regulator [Bacteroidetes bacterium]|nr:helix-turn-helix transcriptional regulator [Bacteroidota bacterium]